MEKEDRAARVLRKLTQQRKTRKPRETRIQRIIQPATPHPGPEESNNEEYLLASNSAEISLKFVERRRAKIALQKQKELRERKQKLSKSVDFGVFSDLNLHRSNQTDVIVERKPAVPRQPPGRSVPASKKYLPEIEKKPPVPRTLPKKKRKKRRAKRGSSYTFEHEALIDPDDRVEHVDFQGADYGNEFDDMVNENEIGLYDFHQQATPSTLIML